MEIEQDITQQAPYNHPKPTFDGEFFNNVSLLQYDWRGSILWKMTEQKIDFPAFEHTNLIKRESNNASEGKKNHSYYLKDFFHDQFQVKPQKTAKHFLSLFWGSLKFVMQERFESTEVHTAELLNISNLLVERDLNSEVLHVTIENSPQKNKVTLNSSFTKDHVLLVNVYLQIHLMSTIMITRDLRDDELREAKIRENKQKNTLLITEFVKVSQEPNAAQAEQMFRDLMSLMRTNCEVIIQSIMNLRYRYRTQGLYYFHQIFYNYVKNFMQEYLKPISQDSTINWIPHSSLMDAQNTLLSIKIELKQNYLSRPANFEVDDEENSGKEMKLDVTRELHAVEVLVEFELQSSKQSEEAQKNSIKDNMGKTKALIDQLFNNKKSTIYHSVLQDDKYVVTFKMLDHYDHFLDLCVIKLKHDQLRCTIHFCKQNYEPILIPDHLTRAHVSRLFTRKVCKIGGFVINPLSGQISFTYSTFNRFSRYSGGELDTFINRVIKSIFTSAYHMINYYFLTLATNIGLISIPIYKHLESVALARDSEKSTKRIKLIPDNFIQRMNNALELLENCWIPFEEFASQDSYKQFFSKEDREDIEQQMDVKNHNTIYDLNESQLEQVSSIEFNEEQMRRISGGGFSDIFSVEAKIELVLPGAPLQSVQSQLAVLPIYALKKSKDEKVRNEAKIINSIRPRSRYIARYYYDNNRPDYLFMDLYYFTLGSYSHFYQHIMSMQTRLNMLLQISQGVKQLQQLGIYHLDLKPPNVLLSDDLQIKICDFGESFSKEVHKDFSSFKKTGRTLPYAAVESLSQPLFSDASDVYSIGAIISEVIFHKRLIEFKRTNQYKIMKQMVVKSYRLVYSDLITKEFGIKQIMKILKILMLKCAHPEPAARPNIDYLIGIFRLFIKVLNDLSV